MSGKFITIEGCEGAGKSTQARLLALSISSRLRQNVLLTREPGGSPGAEKIRGLLLDRESSWDGLTEVMLFLAARRDHAQRVIAPAVSDGRWVVCDRFMDSTIAYQGYGRGLGVPSLVMLNRLVLEGLAPDLTIMLDVPPSEGLSRRRQQSRALDRLEMEELAFHERARAGFLMTASQNPHRCVVVDATAEINAVHAEVLASAISRWPLLDAGQV